MDYTWISDAVPLAGRSAYLIQFHQLRGIIGFVFIQRDKFNFLGGFRFESEWRKKGIEVVSTN
jgi:hypothetical protein